MDGNKSKTITYEGLNFLKIHDREPLFLAQLKSFDGVIVEYSHRLTTKEIINKIRTNNDESIYLIPLFVHKEYGDGSQKDPLIDGILYSLNELGGIANRTRQIKKRMFKNNGSQNGS